MTPFRLFTLSLATSSVLLLAACESDEDKAERYFQSGLALIEQGDNERAAIELRNVFQHDGFHREAREAYAGLMLEMGRTPEAYGQYLRLIEQYPEAVDARVILAELALDTGNWPEVERHGGRAIELAPERLDVRALDMLIQYRAARLADDEAATDAVAAQAATLLEEIRAQGPEDNNALARVVLDHVNRTGTPLEKLTALDAALERDPEAEDLNMLKVRLLEQNGDVAAIGAQLKKMIELFPENDVIKQAIINWYLAQDDLEGVEEFLRAQAGADTGETEDHVVVIQFLSARISKEAALAEVSRLEEANAGTDKAYFYAAMRASMTYEGGDKAQAVADLEGLVDATSDPEQKTNMQVLLAKMLVDVNEPDRADALVATILETDASNVEALKLQAARLIDQDRPGEAIIALRRALNQSPRDVETLPIMAQAHQRDGDTELAGERLALAVEASGNAPTQAVLYARFLLSQDRAQIAGTVLEDARRRAPRNTELLGMLGALRLQQSEWEQAQGIVTDLRALGTASTERAATELQAAILQGQNRVEDSLSVLESQVDDTTNLSEAERTRAVILIIQTQIRSGKIDAARSYLDEALAEAPENPDLKMLDATLNALNGDTESAEAGYRSLIGEYPQSPLPVRLLMNILNSQGRNDESRAVLQAALQRMPTDTSLQLSEAALQEQEGDIDGAIATYETMYAQDSANMIIANNLASLITAHRDDEASLSRAANIVRRLRGTEIPAFQDTYGWIAYRRGDFDEALEYLEPAAAAMNTNALVQYHLGMTYVALGNTPAAKEQLERALALGENSDLPQMQIARDTLETLTAEPAGTTADPTAPAEN